MAYSDKNILITPNKGSANQPNMKFTGNNATTITMNVFDNGTLSWEGTAGQLFSIYDSLSGTIFSVNDVSGIPSIEVLDTGVVKLAQYGGNVLIGSGTDGIGKLQVNGLANLGPNSNVYISGGTNGQVLTTNGSGSLSWTTPSGGSGTVTSVTAGTYLTGGTITTTGTLAVDATTTATASKVVARDSNGNIYAAQYNGNTQYTLNVGSYLTGSNFNNYASVTLAVDATTANTASKIVARDSSGNIYANTIQLASSSTQGITFVPDPGGGSGDTASIRYYVPVSGEKSALVLTVANDADDSIILNPSGNVGVKNTSPTVALDVTGAILASGDITAFSDATLKTNVITISNPLEIIKNLRGVDYTRTDTGEEGSGVIAQEVKPHRPMLVKDHNGTLSVNYNGFSGLFIESIKALIDEIDALKAEIKQLKGE